MIVKNISIFRVFEQEETAGAQRLLAAEQLLIKLGFSTTDINELFEGVNLGNGGGERFRRRYELGPSDNFAGKIHVDFSYEKDRVGYVCLQFEVLRLRGKLARFVFDCFLEFGSDDWFLQLSGFSGFYRVYVGCLSGLRKYLFQDPSVGLDVLPDVVAFRNEDALRDFSWIECEVSSADFLRNLGEMNPRADR